MSNRKVYVSSEDILTGGSDPNNRVTAKFKGQPYVDSSNNYYIAEEAGSKVWHYLLTSVDKLTTEQLLKMINTKIDSVDLSTNDEGIPVINFYSNNELITYLSLNIPRFTYNSKGELEVTIDGVTKTFVPK